VLISPGTKTLQYQSFAQVEPVLRASGLPSSNNDIASFFRTNQALFNLTTCVETKSFHCTTNPSCAPFQLRTVHPTLAISLANEDPANFDLERMLQSLTREDNCPRCSQPSTTTSQAEYGESVLVFLNRKMNDGSKNQQHFPFPESMQLTNNQSAYTLRAVGEHIGNTLTMGHFVAWVRVDLEVPAKYYRVDDEHVETFVHFTLPQERFWDKESKSFKERDRDECDCVKNVQACALLYSRRKM